MSDLTREQVIAWVESQIASCASVGPKGLFSSHLVVQDDGRHFAAILTLLQAAETVAQERDEERRAKETVADAAKAYGAWSKKERTELVAERDRLTQEVAHLREVLRAQS